MKKSDELEKLQLIRTHKHPGCVFIKERGREGKFVAKVYKHPKTEQWAKLIVSIPNEVKKREGIISDFENAWVSMFKFASQCWDTLTNLESAIATLTGETAGQVSARLFKKHKRFLQDNKKVISQRELAQKRFDDLRAILLRPDIFEMLTEEERGCL